MRKILIDSDIIIDILRGLRKTVKEVEELFKENELYISGITEMEIFAGKDAEDNRKRKMMEELLSKFKKINPNNEIFKIAGEFRRKYNISPPDCIIAATSYWMNTELWTRNVTDFEKVVEIRIFLESL